MKKSLLLMMICAPIILAAQDGNGVKVTDLEVNSGTVTFNVSWEKPMPVEVWVDSAWVFVDYNKNGVMTRLPVTSATATAGTVTKISGNDKGVWVAGNARTNDSFSATVQLLTDIQGVAGACAYASNYPPVGEYIETNVIQFTGTAPYTVVLEDSEGKATTYTVDSPFQMPGGCTVKSFTDKTGAPGRLKCIPMTGSIDFSVPAGMPKGLATSFAVLQQNLSIPNAAAVTYTWSAPDFTPNTHTGTPYSPIAPENTGAYTVTLTAHSTGYCDLAMSKNVTVIDCNPSTVYTLEASASGFCAGDDGVTFSLSGTDGGRSYELHKGEGVVASLMGTGNAAAFDGFQTEGIYTAKVLASGGDCAATMDGTRVVNVLPVPIITLVDGSGAAGQNVDVGTAISAISYTASNSGTFTKTGDFPAGVTGAANGSSYTIYGTPTAAGTFGYSLTAAVDGCTSAAAIGTITVTAAGGPQPQGSCTYTEPASVGTFADFHTKPAYTAATYTSLIDERDNKVYPVVKIGGRWVMARNLNYQTGLTFNSASDQANGKTFTAYNTASAGSYAIGSFWCPGGVNGNTATSSTLTSCDVWGALYTWETAMSFNGKGDWTESPSTYNGSGAANTAAAKVNHGRTVSGSGRGGRGICPPNWHVPTDNEWGIILDGMESSGGTAHQNAANPTWHGVNAGTHGMSKCKCASGYCHTDGDVSWLGGGIQGDDLYGFRVLPSGGRLSDGSGFLHRGLNAYFWSSSASGGTYAWYREFAFGSYYAYRRYYFRSYGLSVRCIRDEDAPPPDAASTQTWTFGEQTWSDLIQISACNKPGFTLSNDNTSCRSDKSGKDGTLRYYYNWAYVLANAATLCPGPVWRVPSDADFKSLVATPGVTYSSLANAWGLGGYVGQTGMEHVDDYGALGSTVTQTYNTYWGLYYYAGRAPYAGTSVLYLGQQVRCVK